MGPMAPCLLISDHGMCLRMGPPGGGGGGVHSSGRIHPVRGQTRDMWWLCGDDARFHALGQMHDFSIPVSNCRSSMSEGSSPFVHRGQWVLYLMGWEHGD